MFQDMQDRENASPKSTEQAIMDAAEEVFLEKGYNLATTVLIAKKAGVDPELVFQAIRGGLAGSTVMDAKVPMMLEGR